MKKLLFLAVLISFASSSTIFCTEKDNKVIHVNNINPFYSYWNNEFIIYVDNYNGDINNVSVNDLKSGNGTSKVYIFSKLSDGDYSYDTLMEDIKNTDVSKNLHDAKPILVHLPKSASNNESHALLKDDNEKGKLVSGGPYSKYSKLKNGFYYKGAFQDKKSINKLLSEYKTNIKPITEKISKLKPYSIKDLYKNVHVAYMTNGATNVAGTKDAKIFLLNVDEKFSPYDLTISNLITKDVIKAEATKDFLPDWDIETIYIYNRDDKLIDKISFYDLKQNIWAKQDPGLIEWFNSLK